MNVLIDYKDRPLNFVPLNTRSIIEEAGEKVELKEPSKEG